jgi:hypothetical protein
MTPKESITMNFRRITATTAVATLVAVPTAVLVAAPAHADSERQVACAGGRLELSIDREGNGWEVDAGVDNVAAGQKWRLVVKHDGNRAFKGVRTTDNEGDADIDRWRKDTAGKDTFSDKAVRLSDGTTCRVGVTVG